MPTSRQKLFFICQLHLELQRKGERESEGGSERSRVAKRWRKEQIVNCQMVAVSLLFVRLFTRPPIVATVNWLKECVLYHCQKSINMSSRKHGIFSFGRAKHSAPRFAKRKSKTRPLTKNYSSFFFFFGTSYEISYETRRFISHRI